MDGRRYALARAALRCVLARYLGMSPAELVFSSGPEGKPKIEDGDITFSISRSHDLALFAVTRRPEVGVDIERIGSGIDEEHIAWMFPANTFKALMRLPQAARTIVFLQGWTHLEAYAKARGDGVPAHLASLSDLLCRPRQYCCEEGWWFHDFCPLPSYVASLAARGGKARMRFYDWAEIFLPEFSRREYSLKEQSCPEA
jgi:4'-phosphopantetheinyl transferase